MENDTIKPSHLDFQFTAKEEFTGKQVYGYFVKTITGEHFIVSGMSDTIATDKGNCLSFTKWHRIDPNTLEVMKTKV